jgi:hypothetical protein
MTPNHITALDAALTILFHVRRQRRGASEFNRWGIGAMYRIPTDLNIKGLVGSVLNQIRLGRYDVQFHFDSAACISTQTQLDVFRGTNKIAAWNEENNWSGAEFQALLNEKVVAYSVPNDRLLTVQFESGLALHFHDDSDQYECIQIDPGGIII